MDWAIPAIPPTLLVVLNFLSPYVVSLLIGINFKPAVKKLIAVAISFVLSALIIVLALWAGWVPPLDGRPEGIIFLVAVGLLLQQTAYKNFIQESADNVTRTKGLFALAA